MKVNSFTSNFARGKGTYVIIALVNSGGCAYRAVPEATESIHSCR